MMDQFITAPIHLSLGTDPATQAKLCSCTGDEWLVKTTKMPHVPKAPPTGYFEGRSLQKTCRLQCTRTVYPAFFQGLTHTVLSET